jgi:hypothetical protein
VDANFLYLVEKTRVANKMLKCEKCFIINFDIKKKQHKLCKPCYLKIILFFVEIIQVHTAILKTNHIDICFSLSLFYLFICCESKKN